jgi:hypothetical protein
MLTWPRIQSSNFDITLIIDEDIMWSDIPDFGERGFHIFLGGDQCKEQIPNLMLLEKLLLAPVILDLLCQEVGILGVVENQGPTVPAESLAFELFPDRQQHELWFVF